MVKVTVLYGHPADPEAFEDYYADTHVPIAAKIPDVQRFESGRVMSTPDGEEPAYHRIAELWFESAEQMQSSMGSRMRFCTAALCSSKAICVRSRMT